MNFRACFTSTSAFFASGFGPIQLRLSARTPAQAPASPATLTLRLSLSCSNYVSPLPAASAPLNPHSPSFRFVACTLKLGETGAGREARIRLGRARPAAQAALRPVVCGPPNTVPPWRATRHVQTEISTRRWGERGRAGGASRCRCRHLSGSSRRERNGRHIPIKRNQHPHPGPPLAQIDLRSISVLLAFWIFKNRKCSLDLLLKSSKTRPKNGPKWPRNCRILKVYYRFTRGSPAALAKAACALPSCSLLSFLCTSPTQLCILSSFVCCDL